MDELDDVCFVFSADSRLCQPTVALHHGLWRDAAFYGSTEAYLSSGFDLFSVSIARLVGTRLSRSRVGLTDSRG